MNGAPIHAIYQYSNPSPVQQQLVQHSPVHRESVVGVPPVVSQPVQQLQMHLLQQLQLQLNQQQLHQPQLQLQHQQIPQYQHPQQHLQQYQSLPLQHLPISVQHLPRQSLPSHHPHQQHPHQPQLPHQIPMHHTVYSPQNYTVTHFAPIAPMPSQEHEPARKIPPSEPFPIDETVRILSTISPSNLKEYTEHLFKLGSLLYSFKAERPDQIRTLSRTYYSLIDDFDNYINHEDPVNSKLYLIIERNFDLFIKISTNHRDVDVSTRTIRFLTNVIMHLNYWEIYNLLSWKPSIYHFLTVIRFDLNECYHKFINDYTKYNYKLMTQPVQSDTKRKALRQARRARRAAAAWKADYGGGSPVSDDSSIDTNDDDSDSQNASGLYSLNADYQEHDRFVSDSLAGYTPKEKKKLKIEAKLNAHRIIKKASSAKLSTKSSNYDPDVVHECQLPSPDEPHKVCLRRFSRKYELIRHQETVHSKKKKLFKCYVCVKMHPGIGPRIFTRHDTLAKHIRVNHKISGKEAKAEVAYSKKHAEVVEEGDITVHVGRRKTKVDFELRAHMEKKKRAKGGDDIDESGYMSTSSELDSGDEEVTFNV